MWEITRAPLEKARKEKGLSYEALGAKIGYSDSTVQRWLQDPKKEQEPKKEQDPKNKGNKSAPPYDVVMEIAAILEVDLQEINAVIGKSEMEASQKIGYMGTDRLIAEYEKREQLIRDHCAQLVQHQIELRTQQQATFDHALAELKEAHKETITEIRRYKDASVAHLQTQNKNLRAALVAMLVLFVLSVVFLVAVMAVDAPHIGAAGSVFTAKSPHAFWLWLLGLLSAALAVAYVLLLARRKGPSSPTVSPNDPKTD
jgi:transcriptional regulator with XRE-family HTH domain